MAYLLRRTYRDGVRVKHETLANLSALPQATLEAVRVSLTGRALAGLPQMIGTRLPEYGR